MSDVIIYLGPSLQRTEAEMILPSGPQILYVPPIRRGDLIRAIAAGPKIIGIIDGLFFQNAAVGHREVLSAIRAGIRVVGASSMGALRAAELAPFGMEGIGEVYRRYKDGSIESDDEVAIICDPVTDGALSEALVNIRITLEKAQKEEIIDTTEAVAFFTFAKERYYPDRTWEQIIRGIPFSPEKKETFREWLKLNRVNQKEDDARSALRYIRDLISPNTVFSANVICTVSLRR
ncbi:MAG: TfuA-related McrA-glycine thioamidation protein [Methanobacteriota archaeon]